MAFQVPEDIANRALQHCGAELLDPVQGFSENSRNARQTSEVYDKLREAELRHRVWTFAVRKTALRPVDSNTFLLRPTLWSRTATYLRGALVADENGDIWQSHIADNTGNEPQNTDIPTWEPYFGPLSVMLYDSSQTYFSGELVYTAAGDGSYNTYLSRFSSNAVHPAIPNQWTTLTTYSVDDIVQVFPQWSLPTPYSQGQGVSFQGNVYVSLTNGNAAHPPTSSPANWVQMPTLTLQSQSVPITSLVVLPQSSPILEWSQGQTYALGSFVMFNGATWLSVQNNNTGNFPNALSSTFWKLVFGGTLYMSLIDLNIGNNPTNSSPEWKPSVSYAAGVTVVGSDGQIYTSLTNGNTDNDPTAGGGLFWAATGQMAAWTTSIAGLGGNEMWLQIGGSAVPNGVTLTSIQPIYPIQSGPSSQHSTRNVYRLPNGFLREAPQDPKAGSISFLGAPSGLMPKDWEYDNEFLVTRTVDPIVYRFVANITDVTKFDPMFCEGLAARVALAVCEILTQSSSKVAMIEKLYEKFMVEAVVVGGIEQGPTEPPEDDWIVCRM